MTKRFAIALLLGALVAGATSLSAHERFRFVGTVASLDAAEKLLTIKTRDNNWDLTLEIALTEKTTIERDGKKAAESDLEAGITVVVDAWGDDYFDLEALAIRIVPPIAKKD